MLGILLVLLITFAASAFILDGSGSWPARLIGYIVTPIRSVSASVSGRISSFFDSLLRADEISQENETLRQEIASLREQLAGFNEMERENTLYRYYLGLAKEHPDFEYCPSQVVSRPTGDVYQGFVINKGTLDGISRYDPVITDQGIVGYIAETSDTFSRVMTLLHPDFHAGCKASRTNDTGVLTGELSLAGQGLTRLRYIPRESLVAEGDLILTTGLTGVFPEGLIVGTVKQVSQSAQGVSLDAQIIPAVTPETLDNVFVITAFDGQGTSLEDFINGNIRPEPSQEDNQQEAEK